MTPINRKQKDSAEINKNKTGNKQEIKRIKT
jgi:hypothetical protein